MTSPVAVVEAFLAAWDQPGSWREGVIRHFAPDAVYENIRMSRSEGKDAILAFVRHYEETTGGGWLTVETSAIAAAGNTVLTERVDRMLDGQGAVLLTIPVLGAFDVRGDLIVAWRDYFETAGLAPPYSGPGDLGAAAAG